MRFDDPDALQRSVVTLAEKRAHFAEVQATAAQQAGCRDEIEQRASEYDGFDRRITPRALPA